MVSDEEKMSILEQRMLENKAKVAALSDEYVRLYGEWYQIWAARDADRAEREMNQL